ncbi:glucose-induced degradation complex subunit VID24 ASCRUDRAFT_31065 [Ascoidea rubescens DSM 1968]|uniref:Vacuolar import and degradation protein n=1 Tax=Ascoidea rubescens DSM 1968 TaxID=1344418 RepID=A0A1D2VQG2_9ASCO|nr:hypothetical protein ASCRUDRAFT_31065 [Ascoidea rubescens DSM 1968]ODV63839.1 hypothetical protein ASCRUDRAFT_31065 [Ascoidea rubescens DSM 1968]
MHGESESSSSRNSSGTKVNISSEALSYDQTIPRTTSFLKPGSTFCGFQLNSKFKSRSKVTIELVDVDLTKSTLAGLLTIKSLSSIDYKFTTYFVGEIISEKYNFLTRKPDWVSNDAIDVHHWSKFPSWRRDLKAKVEAETHNNSLYVHRRFLDENYVYMRWKELFLFPDPDQVLENCSFDGFYYICFNQTIGVITGYYFYLQPDLNIQCNSKLELAHIPDGGMSESFELL